ncbi:vacuolar protein sorting-associated protein 41 homolog isoform X2 [Amphiura filiformis]|uniref:vacuolar protein sorting-associated protein 41 homolog isoform X2 n=1 Tax=Amphiura filiformis TaxID=82378 RepID=UPI003B222720
MDKPEDEDVEDTSEEEEGEEEDEEEDSESSEGEEPKLKYERIRNTLERILNKDAASCMAVHTKFLAIGTHWGAVHVIDHQGNTIEGKEFNKHTTTVNQISLDRNGDYIASCSDDGRVAITGLYENEHDQVQNFDCPVKAVALEPRFSRPNSSRQFVTGSQVLQMHEKSFFGRNKSTILHQGEGPIRSIKWTSAFIAWSNDLGVKIYDVIAKRRITFIKRDHDENLRTELYRCNLCWKDKSTLLVGWADRIKVCVVKERERRPGDSKDIPNRFVEIVSMLKTDFYVCGLAPLGEDLIVLAYVTEGPIQEDQDEGEGSRRPQLKVITPDTDDYVCVSSEALSIRGFQEYRASDYHLEYLAEDGVFYIVSPKDVVVARQRDKDDHIDWLIESEKYEEALAETKANEKVLQRHKVQEVGRAYLNHLIEEEQFERAACMCEPILGKNAKLWEVEVYRFAKLGKLNVISPHVPRGDTRLGKALYEMILNDYLQKDIEGFHQLIKEWPADLYDLMTIVNAVQERLQRWPQDQIDPDNRRLMQTLGDLYSYDGRYDKALAIYLKLGHKDIFQLIYRHDLFTSIQDKIALLMEFDNDQAVKMLIENSDKIPVKKVVHQLQGHQKFQHNYLDALFQKNPHLGQEYHALQVKLYAEHDRKNLLMFLKNSNYYPLQVALDECEQRHLIPEMVFLLGRMGNTKQALRLIMEDLDDVDKAIDFAKEHDDTELWDDLIAYSMDKPMFIRGLLNNIGTHVDPIRLINRIKERMEIPGLRDSLVKILQDYNLQISLREGCKKILVSDCFSLMERLNRIQKKGIRVEERQHCDSCHEPILSREFQPTVIVFHCHHVFHEECLIAVNMEHCMICHSKTKGPGGTFTGSPAFGR